MPEAVHPARNGVFTSIKLRRNFAIQFIFRCLRRVTLGSLGPRFGANLCCEHLAAPPENCVPSACETIHVFSYRAQDAFYVPLSRRRVGERSVFRMLY